MTPQEEKKLDQLAEQEGSDQLTTAIRQKKVLEDLKNSPGWRMIAEFIQEQVTLRTTQIMRTPMRAEDVPAQNFSRGEASFGELILNMPEVRIGEANDVIEMFNKVEVRTDGDPNDE